MQERVQRTWDGCWSRSKSEQNLQKPKFVVLATPESRTRLLKEAESNPIKMGETIIENSRAEKKQPGYQIHEDGTSASIHATLDSIIPIAIKRGDGILHICKQPSLILFNLAQRLVKQYESKISSKILANSESWIGLNESHINRMQKVRDGYFM